MSLTAKDVQEIMTLLEGSTFDRLMLEVDGLKLELERGGTGAPRPARKGPASGSQGDLFNDLMKQLKHGPD